MKNLTVFAILICATAVSLFTVPPCAAQQVNYNYVYFEAGASPATRYPTRSSTGAGSIVPIPIPGLNYSTGYSSPLNVSTSPQQTYTFTNNNNVETTYSLAYVNVQGGIGGGITVFPAGGTFPSNVSVPLPTGSSLPNIVVQYVYFPAGGGGRCLTPPCATGAGIDEFDEMTGNLIDDEFVTVYIPPLITADSGLTTTANDYGTVDTTNNGVRINAYQNTTTGGAFDKWVTGPAGTIGSDIHDLNVNNQTDVYALAFYQGSCPANYYWNPSPTISQCSPIPMCPTGQYWNSNNNQCSQIPTCTVGQVWNGYRCVAAAKCPTNCKYGCIWHIIPPGPPAEPPVLVCRGAPPN